MDVPDAPPPGLPGACRPLTKACAAPPRPGSEITEMGMRDWRYLDALGELRRGRCPPVSASTWPAGSPRTPAPARPTPPPSGQAGQLGKPRRREVLRRRLARPAHLRDGARLRRRRRHRDPVPDRGGTGPADHAASCPSWRIATHAIGDRGVATVLDAYDLAWDGDRAAIAAAAPQIERPSLQSAELIRRLAASGVVACLQPSFAVTDVPDVGAGLDPARAATAYPWAALAAARRALLRLGLPDRGARPAARPGAPGRRAQRACRFPHPGGCACELAAHRGVGVHRYA